MMKNIASMMKKAQEMQNRMGELQGQVDASVHEGQSGGGAVRLSLSGTGTLIALHIDPAVFKDGDADMLEDLIKIAHNDAKARADAYKAEMMSQLTAGLPLPPGLKLPF